MGLFQCLQNTLKVTTSTLFKRIIFHIVHVKPMDEPLFNAEEEKNIIKSNMIIKEKRTDY